MEIPTLDETVIHLAKAGIYANKGNPGTVMPDVTRPLVAVNYYENTFERQTLEAAVCGPQSEGRQACDRVAEEVARHFADLGGQCKWGDYRFDGKSAMHIVKVYATWFYE